MPKSTSRTNRRRRHRILALVAAGAVAVAVALVVVLIWVNARETKVPSVAVPPTSAPPGAVPPGGKQPRPEFQDASCPDVQVVSVPGTWESSPQLDPLNPTQFPIALLLNVTNPIRQQFDNGRVEVYTV